MGKVIDGNPHVGCGVKVCCFHDGNETEKNEHRYFECRKEKWYDLQ